MYFYIYTAIYYVVSLTELPNSPFSPANFLDDTIDRSPFFMDGVDSSLKSIIPLGTDLTFVLYIMFCFFLKKKFLKICCND
jgi:hypothetical protein